MNNPTDGTHMGGGCAERERMVETAIENGWIQRMAARARHRSALDVVVVVAGDGATDVPGALGDVVRHALQTLPRMPTAMRDTQRAAGCPPFVVFGVPLVVLCQLVDTGTAEDLRDAARANTYAVLCVNAGRVVLVSGVSRTMEVES